MGLSFFLLVTDLVGSLQSDKAHKVVMEDGFRTIRQWNPVPAQNCPE